MCRICGGLIVFDILFAYTSCVVHLQIFKTVELVTSVQIQYPSLTYNSQGLFRLNCKCRKDILKQN